MNLVTVLTFEEWFLAPSYLHSQRATEESAQRLDQATQIQGIGVAH
jgi:hypothetical protein